MRQPSKPKADMQGPAMYLRPFAVSLGLGIGVCFVMLLLFSFVMSAKDIPQSFVSPLGVVAAAIGALSSGYFAAKLIGTKGLVVGLICGIVLFAMLTLASLAVYGDGFGILALTKLIAIVCAAAFGGIMGVNARKRRR